MSILFLMLLMLNSVLIFFLITPFITVLLSIFSKEKELPEIRIKKETDFACIITAYKNIRIAIPLIESFLKQRYDNFKIYLVIDQCEMTDVIVPPSDKIVVLQPETGLNSKVKSIMFAMDHLQRNHEAILILDPDNLGHPNLLTELNRYFHAGYRAVQGRRIAKNLDSVYECLDATSEMYFNYTLKYAPFLLKSSANISGSGMAIETTLFKEYLKSNMIVDKLDRVIVAEDKILQNFLVGKNIIIAFAKQALLYDEKVGSANQVVRQRTRWINSYFENIRHACSLIYRGMIELNLNKFLFGLLTVLPPLFIIMITSSALLVMDIALYPGMALALIMAMIVFKFNFLLVLYLARAPKKIWKNLYGIPVFMLLQIIATLKMKKANKDFLATEHKKYVNIENLADKRS